MHVVVTGITYRTAPLAVRERLALERPALAALLASTSAAGFDEAVVVSTCGRTELYAAAREPAGGARLADLLADAAGVEPAFLESHIETRYDAEAVRHLLRVSAGLDSLVLGEHEILGQIGDALEIAQDAGTMGAVFIKVFHAAIRAGRRARAETKIAEGASSVPAVAADAAQSILGKLAGRPVLVVGAGAMASKAVRALTRRGAGPVTVLNRTVERAVELADRHAARAAGLGDLGRALASADIVVTSTGASHPVIGAAQLRSALAARDGRPMLIVDMAVPRDVEPAARGIEGLTVLDLDDLASRAAGNLTERQAELPRVEVIVEEEKERAMEWLEVASVLPTIASLRSHAEEIRAAELTRALRRLPRLTPAERKAIEAFSRSLVKKLLHEPTVSLKAEAGGAGAAELARAARRLFALDGTTGAAAGNTR